MLAGLRNDVRSFKKTAKSSRASVPRYAPQFSQALKQTTRLGLENPEMISCFVRHPIRRPCRFHHNFHFAAFDFIEPFCR